MTGRSLRAHLLEIAHGLLAELDQLPGPTAVSAGDDLAVVSITVTPAGVQAGAGPALSPMERDLLQALRAAGRPLVGKQLAARSGYAYDSTLKTILSNLVARGVLRAGGEGYEPV